MLIAAVLFVFGYALQMGLINPFINRPEHQQFLLLLAIATLLVNGCLAIAEESWTKPGGMDDRAEVYGSKGVAYANLLRGNSIETYSSVGYNYAVKKADLTTGWSFAIYEEAWNYGFPQEMAHFVDCVAHDKPPAVTGEDGRAVLEVIFAAYESAATGRKISLPFVRDASRPVDLWLGRAPLASGNG